MGSIVAATYGKERVQNLKFTYTAAIFSYTLLS
jgi:hypothetical protein